MRFDIGRAQLRATCTRATGRCSRGFGRHERGEPWIVPDAPDEMAQPDPPSLWIGSCSDTTRTSTRNIGRAVHIPVAERKQFLFEGEHHAVANEEAPTSFACRHYEPTSRGTAGARRHSYPACPSARTRIRLTATGEDANWTKQAPVAVCGSRWACASGRRLTPSSSAPLLCGRRQEPRGARLPPTSRALDDLALYSALLPTRRAPDPIRVAGPKWRDMRRLTGPNHH